MKKSLLILFVFISVSLHAEIIKKTYYFNNYQTKVIGDYQTINFENTFLTGKAGEPLLPYQSVKYLLPAGEIAESVEFIGEEETIIPGVFQLYPKQYSHPVSSNHSNEFIKNKKIYSRNSNYPSSQTGILSTQFLNGYSFGFTSFTPIKYNPVTGKISYFKKVTIKIKTKNNKTASFALNNLKSNNKNIKQIQKFSDNSEYFSTYPIKKANDSSYQMLIITSSEYQNSFQSLIDLYIYRGIKTQVQTTDYIYNNMSGVDNPEKIRNYIIQEYQNYDIEYVLLGGDIEIVPARGLYCKAISSQIYEDNNIPSDIYYSALDGTWNANNNNSWGEYIVTANDTLEEADLLPELSVARLPFSNTTELNNIINKSISYQDNPVYGELKDPLMVGEYLTGSPETWSSDYLELLIGHHDDNGYTTDGIPESDNFTKLYEKNAYWSKSDLITEINNGHSFLYHSGHANETYVMKLSNGDITNSNFNMVNGNDHNYSLIYTHGCLCGSFDYSDCIGEKMVTLENFAVAFIGNSRFGWFNEGQTEGPSIHIQREFVNALYSDKLCNIGTAHKISKQNTAPWVTAPGQWEEGALRWCFYDCNVLSDPALAIWTDEPSEYQVNYPNVITMGTNNINVNVISNGSPVANINCVLIQDSTIFGCATTDEQGNATVNINTPFNHTGDAELVISGYNCPKASYPVTIIPGQGAYISFSDTEINDLPPNGNGNSLIDFGETIKLGFTFKNIGIAETSNIQFVLSSQDPYINITSQNYNYNNIIYSGDSVIVANAFCFDVSDSIPDQHSISLLLTAQDISDSTWTENIILNANAPLLKTGTFSIIDSITGNDNGVLDPGESALINIETSNQGHCNCSDISCTLSSNYNYLTINNPVQSIDTLKSNETKIITYSVSLSENSSIGDKINLNYNIISGYYNYEKIFILDVGIIKEDFEKGDFLSHNWNFGGSSNWTISNNVKYEGQYSAKSGEIGNNSFSEMNITFDVLSADSISFYRKVSSEENFDYLYFSVDGDIIAQWSGEKDWERESFAVPVGRHTFKWSYSKDEYSFSGDDCAWIDYIVFPPVSEVVGLPEFDNNFSINIFPNPAKDILNIKYKLNKTSNVKITLLNALGQKIKTLKIAKNLNAGTHIIFFNTSNLELGIYFCNFEAEKKSVIKKIIILSK